MAWNWAPATCLASTLISLCTNAVVWMQQFCRPDLAAYPTSKIIEADSRSIGSLKTIIDGSNYFYRNFRNPGRDALNRCNQSTGPALTISDPALHCSIFLSLIACEITKAVKYGLFGLGFWVVWKNSNPDKMLIWGFIGFCESFTQFLYWLIDRWKAVPVDTKFLIEKI